jgi:hypothetical protein
LVLDDYSLVIDALRRAGGRSTWRFAIANARRFAAFGPLARRASSRRGELVFDLSRILGEPWRSRG